VVLESLFSQQAVQKVLQLSVMGVILRRDEHGHRFSLPRERDAFVSKADLRQDGVQNAAEARRRHTSERGDVCFRFPLLGSRAPKNGRVGFPELFFRMFL